MISLHVSVSGLLLLNLTPLDGMIMSGKVAAYLIMGIMFGSITLIYLNPPNLNSKPFRALFTWLFFFVFLSVSIFTGIFGFNYSASSNDYANNLKTKLKKFGDDSLFLENHMATTTTSRIALHAKKAKSAAIGEDPSGTPGHGYYYNTEIKTHWELKDKYRGLLETTQLNPNKDISLNVNEAWANANQRYLHIKDKLKVYGSLILDEELPDDYGMKEQALDIQHSELKDIFHSENGTSKEVLTVKYSLAGLKSLITNDINTNYKVLLAVFLAALLDMLAFTLALIRSHHLDPTTRLSSEADFMIAQLPAMNKFLSAYKDFSVVENDVSQAQYKRERRDQVFRTFIEEEIDPRTLQ